jgi:hypothetical protein
MQDSSQAPEANTKLEKLSRIYRLARLILNGPRAAMFPDDPKGLTLWLEPIVALTAHFAEPKKSESLIVYMVPNCLERSPTGPVLIRRCTWESGKDRDSVRQGGHKVLPTTITAYWQLPVDQMDCLDGLLRDLDSSLMAFPFPTEGLDRYGPAGFKPLPVDAVIDTDTVHNELRRTTRFYFTEFRWSPSKQNLSKFDQGWQALFETLVKLSENAELSTRVDMMEKFDIDLLAYSKFLDSTASAPS